MKVFLVSLLFILTGFLYLPTLKAQMTVYSLDSALMLKEKVSVLYLQSKELKTLPSALAQCTNLKELYIDNNEFKTLPEVVYQLKSLELLSVAGCNSYMDWFEKENLLESIEEGIGNLSELRSLNLSYNRIKKMPASFSNLKKLTTLNLQYNELNTKEELKKITGCVALEYLELSANDIKELPDEFSNLQRLNTLYLANRFAEGCPTGEMLDAFPLVLCKITSLKDLGLEGHYIEKIPEEIGNLKNLVSLSLTESLFLTLPESIGNLANLQELYFNSLYIGKTAALMNKKVVLPKSFCNLKNLKVLVTFGTIPSKTIAKIKSCIPDCKINE